MTEGENAQVATTVGIMGGAAMYQTFAVVAALAEARVIDPMKVVAWAEFFAENQPASLAPEIRERIRDQVKDFAATLRKIATTPPNAGRG